MICSDLRSSAMICGVQADPINGFVTFMCVVHAPCEQTESVFVQPHRQTLCGDSGKPWRLSSPVLSRDRKKESIASFAKHHCQVFH